ncbi:hypothetical protein K438DRAFT_2020453 [Mycena galopus ATCC 62051]|nr:hypothetical protein K438DRAFT_2020453 [Mycena galopus ATCC 62051]
MRSTSANAAQNRRTDQYTPGYTSLSTHKNFFELNSDHLLENPEFVTKMRQLVQFVVPGESETKSWFGENLDKVSKLVGISAAITAAATGPMAPIAVPAIAGVGLSVLFVAYLTRAYQSAQRRSAASWRISWTSGLHSSWKSFSTLLSHFDPFAH